MDNTPDIECNTTSDLQKDNLHIDFSGISEIELRGTTLPVLEVFELFKEGHSNKQIEEALGLHKNEAAIVKSLAAFRKLKKEWIDEANDRGQAYKHHQTVSFEKLALKATERLEELLDSPNDKVVLDASKYIVDHLKRLHDTQVDDQIHELEGTIINIISNEDGSTTYALESETVEVESAEL